MGTRGLVAMAASAALAFSMGMTDATPPATHVDNPYAGVRGYVNPEWRAHADAEAGGSLVSNNPTAVWLDRIAAIEGAPGRMGVRDHLDAALAQGAGYIQFVTYNLPGRSCPLLVFDGDLAAHEIDRYEREYIDPIAEILSDPAYAGLRVITVIEPGALPGLIANTGSRQFATPTCETMRANGNYVRGIRYAVARLHAIPHVYTYVDMSNHGLLGWDDNFYPAARLLADVVGATDAGLAGIDGIAINVAGYAALREPFIVVDDATRQSRWIDWNRYTDELSFARALRDELISLRFPAGIGVLIDTSRNGWGGPDRPTEASTAPDLNQRIDESRVDRRFHKINWCNERDAGIGERPRAAPVDGVDAYAWVKPPGESDGADEPWRDRSLRWLCDPEYGGNASGFHHDSGALAGAPERGQWFPAHFQRLLANAHPPLAPN
ncbi:glycoside hydrolase family 6 protein [Actinomycetes bacterium KLBMP 9797]